MGFEKFWVAYMQSGFQGNINEDADPNDEEGIVTAGESIFSGTALQRPIQILAVENLDATHVRARIRVGLILETDKGQFTQNIDGTDRTFRISRVESYNGDEMIALVNKAADNSIPPRYISPVVTAGNATIIATLCNSGDTILNY